MNTPHIHTSSKEMTAMLQKCSGYAEVLVHTAESLDYARHESALAVAGDAAYQDEIIASLKGYAAVKHVVLVGIGGSSLGTEAVYRALRTPLSPTLLVIDALEASSLDAYVALLKQVKNPKHIALVIISKSGTTTETVANADLALALFDKAYGAKGASQVIAIGDEDSVLVQAAKKKKIRTFYIPKAIGGRYSVFTAAGMVPLALLGIDTRALRAGAVDAVTAESLHIASESAALMALHAKAGGHTLNFFTFTERLATFGYWYRQLLAESLGKPQTKRGKRFKSQLLPVVSTSIDLHSVAQLYLGDYEGVYTKFVHDRASAASQMLGKTWVSKLVPALSKKSPRDVKEAVFEGVLKAYDEAGLPYDVTVLDDTDAYTLGNMLAESMCEVMMLCHLLDVDAFDQPNVESYKKHVRAALT